MIHGYIKKIFKPKGDEKIIPIHWNAQRFFHFYFTGWNLFNFNTESSEFLNAIKITSTSIQTFYSIYSDKFAFTEPIFSLDKDSNVSIKFGVMELKLYEEICKRDLEKMKRRKPKETDQQEIEKAFNILKEYVHNHLEIEPTLLASVFWSILVDGYIKSGMNYDQFTREWDRVKHQYKHWFD